MGREGDYSGGELNFVDLFDDGVVLKDAVFTGVEVDVEVVRPREPVLMLINVEIYLLLLRRKAELLHVPLPRLSLL